MERYLDNIGFFNSKVEFETTFKHKTSVVKFTIHPSIPYKISKIDYTISDTTLKQFFDITLKVNIHLMVHMITINNKLYKISIKEIISIVSKEFISQRRRYI